jgi:hypothetical protein
MDEVSTSLNLTDSVCICSLILPTSGSPPRKRVAMIKQVTNPTQYNSQDVLFESRRDDY